MEISGIEVSVLKIERMECEKSRDLAAIIINRGFSGVTISNAIFKFGGDKSNGHFRHPVFLFPVSARDCALVLGCTEARNPHDATWVNQSIISNSQVPHPFYVNRHYVLCHGQLFYRRNCLLGFGISLLRAFSVSGNFIQTLDVHCYDFRTF